MSEQVIFDIETGTRSDAEKFAPFFEAPKNYKDPDKIMEAINEKREKWLDKCALSAVTGKILAIGYKVDDSPVVVLTGDEKTIITQFFDIAIHPQLIGFNSMKFDLPYLVRRGFGLGVDIASHFAERKYYYGGNQYHVDLMQLWQCNDRQETISLDRLARYLGLKGKSDPIGANFEDVFREDKSRAVKYSEEDVELTYQVAKRMGL